MKNTTQTVDGTDMPTNFDGESLSSWRWEGKLTLDVICNFLMYLSGLINWLTAEGKTLLEKDKPLTYEEWKLLSGRAFNLWYQMDTERPVCLLFMSVVKKGISSLKYAIENDPCKNRFELITKYHDWVWGIQYQLHPGARFGIGSRSCKSDESRQLIESMIPVAQLMKDEHLLACIASDRFPQEKEVQQMFIKEHKNW